MGIRELGALSLYGARFDNQCHFLNRRTYSPFPDPYHLLSPGTEIEFISLFKALRGSSYLSIRI